MASNFYMLNNIFISFIWEQKINILGGVFLGITVYSYWHRKIKIRKEIFELKKQNSYYEILTINLILTMTDSEKFSIKEMLSNLNDEFKSFKFEMRQEIKELVSTFHEYKTSNNDRIASLEGDQKVTAKTIIIYIGFIGMFVMLAINTYMSFVGK